MLPAGTSPNISSPARCSSSPSPPSSGDAAFPAAAIWKRCAGRQAVSSLTGSIGPSVV